jgi:hypothetical protein
MTVGAQAQVSGFCTSPLVGHARHSHFPPIKTCGGVQVTVGAQDLPFEAVPEGHAQAQLSGFCTSPLIGHPRHSHFPPIKTCGGAQTPTGCDTGGGVVTGVPHCPFACSGVVDGQQSGAVALLPVPHVGPVAKQPVRAWFGVDPAGQLPLDKGGQNGVVPGRSQVGGCCGGGGWISERTQVLVSGL